MWDFSNVFFFDSFFPSLAMWDFVGEVAQFEQKAHPGGLAAARG
jgi:hypothetical protein